MTGDRSTGEVGIGSLFVYLINWSTYSIYAWSCEEIANLSFILEFLAVLFFLRSINSI